MLLNSKVFNSTRMDAEKLGNKRKVQDDKPKFTKEERKRYREQKLLKLMEEHIAGTSQETLVEVTESQQAVNIMKPNLSTLTIAVPGSILENAQTPALRAYLAGQIARAAVIYKVHEVVIFDDVEDQKTDSFDGTSTRYSTAQFAKLLQYLECPQYLRKKIFPLHKDLEFAGIMNPLDCPHHLRSTDISTFREGIVTSRQSKNTYVNVGLQKDALVDRNIQPGIRVTVKLDSPESYTTNRRGTVVSPLTPEIEQGVYWGYTVRVAGSISQVFSQSIYKGGYDVTVGTSEKGKPIDEITQSEMPNYSHALVVFGGLNGLEQAIESDPLQEIDDPMYLFDVYINTCPAQGSNTIRTEEAVLITLAELRKKLLPIIKNKSS